MTDTPQTGSPFSVISTSLSDTTISPVSTTPSSSGRNSPRYDPPPHLAIQAAQQQAHNQTSNLPNQAATSHSSIPTVTEQVISSTTPPGKLTNPNPSKQSSVNMATTGPNSLPIPGSKGAPRKFRGRYDHVKTFVQIYEKLCATRSITDGQDKIDNITQYCSKNVREFMEGLPSYSSGNWKAFSEDVLEYFDADRDARRYRVHDLEKYVHNTKQRTFKDLSTWKRYNRGFIHISGWLVRRKKLEETDNNLYFWKGISKKFRNKLEARLLSQHPNHDPAKPWTVKQIQAAADIILQRNRFDHERMPSDSDTEDDFSTLDMSSSDESQDSDSSYESDYHKSHKHKKESSKRKHKKKKTSRSRHDTDKESDNEKQTTRSKKALQTEQTTDTKAKSKGSEEEIEDLINWLNRMSINDADYAGLYFRAIKLNPLVKDILETLARQKQAVNASTPRNGLPDNVTSTMPARPSTSPNFQCFGCGEVGHTASRCPSMAEMVQKGVIIRDQLTGRLLMKNGDPIRKLTREEPLIKAITRQMVPQSNFVTVNHIQAHEMTDDYYESDYYESDSESSDFDIEYEEPYGLAVTRSGKRITTNRQEKNEGVIGAAKKEFNRRRIRPREDSAQAPRYQDLKKRNNENDVKATPATEKLPTHKPIDVFPPAAINPNDSDTIMEDPELPKRPPATSTPIVKARIPSTPDKENPAPQEKRVARKSEVQTNVDPLGILEKVLKTPVTLQIGEVFGISREMAHHLQDAIKPKRAIMARTENISAKPPLVAAYAARTNSALIKIQLECDGRAVEGIVDTGSQLNVAHVDIWRKILRCPLDMSRSVTMNDANGGEGTLNGFLRDVPLSCGEALTKANIFVGDNAPFQLLLGRPWQRGNFISIYEEDDGTYLAFQNPQRQSVWKLLVTPEERSEDEGDSRRRKQNLTRTDQPRHARPSNQSYYTGLATSPVPELMARIEELPDDQVPTDDQASFKPDLSEMQSPRANTNKAREGNATENSETIFKRNQHSSTFQSPKLANKDFKNEEDVANSAKLGNSRCMQFTSQDENSLKPQSVDELRTDAYTSRDPTISPRGSQPETTNSHHETPEDEMLEGPFSSLSVSSVTAEFFTPNKEYYDYIAKLRCYKIQESEPSDSNSEPEAENLTLEEQLGNYEPERLDVQSENTAEQPNHVSQPHIILSDSDTSHPSDGPSELPYNHHTASDNETLYSHTLKPPPTSGNYATSNLQPTPTSKQSMTAHEGHHTLARHGEKDNESPEKITHSPEFPEVQRSDEEPTSEESGDTSNVEVLTALGTTWKTFSAREHTMEENIPDTEESPEQKHWLIDMLENMREVSREKERREMEYARKSQSPEQSDGHEDAATDGEQDSEIQETDISETDDGEHKTYATYLVSTSGADDARPRRLQETEVSPEIEGKDAPESENLEQAESLSERSQGHQLRRQETILNLHETYVQHGEALRRHETMLQEEYRQDNEKEDTTKDSPDNPHDENQAQEGPQFAMYRLPNDTIEDPDPRTVRLAEISEPGELASMIQRFTLNADRETGGIEIQNDDSQEEILGLLQTPEEARQQVEDLLEDARR